MKKKILLSLLLLPLMFTLVACGNNKKKGTSPVAGQNVTMSVNSGRYTVTDDGNRLALKIKLVNDSHKKSITAMADEFTLVDKNGDRLKGTSTYNDGDFDTDNLSKGDKTQGYVYFNAKKDTKYTLKYSSLEDGVKVNTVSVNTKKYKDNSTEPKKALEAAINTILLNKEDKNYDKYVANDKDELKNDFKDKINENIEESVFTSEINAPDVDKVAKAVQKFNLEHGKIDVKVKSMTDKEATLSVDTKLINLDAVADKAEDLQDKKSDEAIDNDQDFEDAEKQASADIANKIADYLKVDDLKSSDDIMVKLEKTGDKWKIDNSDEEFGMLVDPFTGNIY